MPEPVVAWFGWHDGQGEGQVELVPDGIPISLGEALELRAQQLAVADHLGPEAPTGWQSSWLPLLVDRNCTAFWVVDCDEAAAPVFLRDIEQPDATPVFGSLDAMVVTVTAGYVEGALTPEPDGMVVEDAAAFAALRRQHGGLAPPADEEWHRYLERLASTDFDEIAVAVNALDRGVDHMMVPGLLRILADAPVGFSRARAVDYLARTGDPAAVQAVLGALGSDPDPEVREMAASCAGDFSGDAAREALLAALEDPGASVRARAVASLGEFALKGHPEVAQAIRGLADDPVTRVRFAVAQTLSRLEG